jgi:universal stress protein A
MPAIKRMLVPTDFSHASDMSFKYALDLASRDRSAMHLLHVVDDGHVTGVYADGIHVEVHALRGRLIEAAGVSLRDLVARCESANLSVTTEVVAGRPASVIVDRATMLGTDLIVMGTHGRNGFAHLVLGSVAERVMRTAPCPVLAVRNTARVADALYQGAQRQPFAFEPA